MQDKRKFEKNVNWSLLYDLRDEKQVKEYMGRLLTEYSFQCNHEKDSDGCQRLGDFYEMYQQQFDKSYKVFEKNCTDNSHARSCYKLGIYKQLGRKCDQNIQEAYSHYITACEAKQPLASACFQAAAVLTTGDVSCTSDPKKQVFHLLSRGCELEDAKSCYQLAAIYNKQGSEEDLKNSVNYLRLACDQHDYLPACSSLSYMYRKGLGTVKDLTMAKRYRKMAESMKRAVTEKQPDVTFGQ